MPKSNKILLGWLAFVFVVGHTAAIVVFAFPQGYLPQSLKNASSVYVSPVFDQTWSLFAPCPVIDGKLQVQYFFEEDSTGWIEPLKNEHLAHSRYRITHHGDLILGESNLLYYVGNDLQWIGISPYESFPDDTSSIARYKQTSSYWMMRNFIHGSADFVFEKRPTRAFAKCSFQNVKTGESGSLILPEFSWKKND